MDLEGIDLTDLEVFADGFPHEVFTRLRGEAPVWWHEPTAHTPDGVGFWVLSGYEPVQAAVCDAVTFSSERAPGHEGGGTLIADLPYGFAAGVLLNMTDDPWHHHLRRLVTPAVAPRSLERMKPELEALADAILDGAATTVAETGECDFLSQVAVELPIRATLQLLGVPAEDRHQLVAWTNATLTYDDRDLGEETARTQQAAAAMAAYAEELIAKKRAEPTDDLLSAVVHAQVPDDGTGRPLSALELSMFFSLLIAAGSETTRNALALGMAALIEHPDQLAALASDARLMPTATEEILRWSSPTLYNRRSATADTQLGGHRISAGDKVTLWWASADFDESVFADPFAFDIRRDPNPHVAFGYKTHFCLGAGLARLEIRILVERLLARFCDFELTGPIRRARTNKHAGVTHMPVRFTDRA